MEQRTCSVDGCTDPHAGRGYCAIHYQHWYRWGDPLYYAPPAQKICSFPDCGGKVDSHGLCSAHATQLRKGQELKPLRVLWHGASCTVDGCEKSIVARGYCGKHWKNWRIHGDPEVADQHRREGNTHHQRRRTAYALNESFFDEVLTEEQAYWLGFITADGGIIRSGSKTYSLRVELAERDGDHVKLLAAALGSDKPLWHRRSFIGSSFDSWRLTEALEHLGITPRKSATVQPWDGPADLMRHYWRGMFDGDGSIYKVRTTGCWALNMTGSRACVEAFAIWAGLICGSRAIPRHAKGGCWAWTVGGSRMAQRLAEALYANAIVMLERKALLAAELCSLDFGKLHATANAQRAASMRDAWDSGRHPRSKVIPG